MTPRKGDRVRVTYEAEYVSGDALGHRVIWRPAHPSPPELVGLYIPRDAAVEVIEDLRPGDVYRGAVESQWPFVYDPDGSLRRPWFGLAGGSRFADVDIPRPLTLLVRDGKPVTP